MTPRMIRFGFAPLTTNREVVDTISKAENCLCIFRWWSPSFSEHVGTILLVGVRGGLLGIFVFRYTLSFSFFPFSWMFLMFSGVLSVDIIA